MIFEIIKNNNTNMYMKFLNIPLFLVSLAIGLFVLYISMPPTQVIYVYPNPDNIDNFLDAFKNATLNQGQISGKLVQIAENKFCSIGLWESQSAMDEAMDDMISFLDTIRHMLITISEELGVTDPASGPVLIEHN